MTSSQRNFHLNKCEIARELGLVPMLSDAIQYIIGSNFNQERREGFSLDSVGRLEREGRFCIEYPVLLWWEKGEGGGGGVGE